jgi:broad specificity phosphatase PhoE
LGNFLGRIGGAILKETKGKMNTKNTRVILVRHGETEANLLQMWHGSLDAPLTARGRLQVAATAERFRGCIAHETIDMLYVSPLPRARSTAAAIAEAIGLEAVVEEGLREFSIGDWEGRTYRDLMDNEQLWRRWAIDPTFTPPNGESPMSFGERAVAALEQLAAQHRHATIVAVSHGGLIGAVLDAWLGERSGDWMRFEPHNCAVSVLDHDGDRWHGTIVNDISHIPEEGIIRERPDYHQEPQEADYAD